MLIEVIHINGQYSPDMRSHAQPKGMASTYYKELSSILQQAIERGASVIYRPNLYSIAGNPEVLAAAMQSDPFLNEFTNHSALIFQPELDGRNLEQIQNNVHEEDRLVRQHGTAIILGAYSKWCVPAVAHNLMSRNPGHRIGIDLDLSIDNGGRFLRMEHERVPHLSLKEMLSTETNNRLASDDMSGSTRPDKGASELAFPRPSGSGE